MKKYRAIVPIFLIAVMALSFYKLIRGVLVVGDEYVNYVVKARRYAKDGITKAAIENYDEALKLKSSPDLFVEVSEYYKQQNLAKDNLSWCKRFLEAYPKEYRAYDCILNIYVEDEDYASCYDILNVADKRHIHSEYMDTVSEEIKYKFSINFNSYSDVGIYSNNYCPVLGKNYWGFVDRFGNQKISCRYAEVGCFTQSGLAPVVDKDNSIYFIDKSGDKTISLSGEYKSFGILVNGMFPAISADGKYIYLKENSDKNYFGSVEGDLYVKASEEMYEYASAFNSSFAVVKSSGKWYLIDDKFNKGAVGHIDVKLDEKDIATRNDRLFVADTPGKYYMIDVKGQKIGNHEYEDAKLFLGSEPTVVKSDGKWRFIDKNGNYISEKTYDDAHPFSNGLAAVCVNGKWGFVDEKENVVIQPQFSDCKDFNDKGSCFVKINENWKLLQLYRLNRKG